MSDIGLNQNLADPNYGDLLISNGDLVIVTGLTEIQQNVLQNVRTFLGEWFLDNTVGVPYFQQILVKNPDQGKVDALIQNAILSTPGIVQLLSYASSINTQSRSISIQFKALSTSGVIDYAGLVP